MSTPTPTPMKEMENYIQDILKLNDIRDPEFKKKKLLRRDLAPKRFSISCSALYVQRNMK